MKALFREVNGPCTKGCGAPKASLIRAIFLVDVGQGELAVSILKFLSEISIL